MLLNSIRKKFSSFRRDRNGTVAIIFGLAAMLLFMLAGAAIDFSQAVSVRQKLGNALDAAALAVGSSGTLSQEDAEELAQDIFDANYPDGEIGTAGELSVVLSGQTVSMTASAIVDTAFLGIAGLHTIPVSIANEVTREGKNLEIVMVLDNTGSMSGSKIADLKTAAHSLVDITFGEDSTSDTVKIGLVPFAAAVNIGTNAVGEGWIDTAGNSSVNAYNYQPNTNVYQLWQDMAASNQDWRGCVEARDGGFDTRDKAPSIADPETLWVPYLYPDEPDTSSSYRNDYFNDQIGGSEDQRQRNDAKYDDGLSLKSGNPGPNYLCPRNSILPLTNQKADLTNAIDAMLAEYTTNIPVGLAWGWRTISKKKPFNEGAAYTDEDTIKAIILLTDGENFIGSQNNHNKSRYGAYGFVNSGRLGTTNANTAVTKLNNKTSQLCTRIKNKGIILYTITFQVPTTSIKTLMENCATDSTKYFDSPSGSELNNVFGIIAKELSNLRLSK